MRELCCGVLPFWKFYLRNDQSRSCKFRQVTVPLRFISLRNINTEREVYVRSLGISQKVHAPSDLVCYTLCTLIPIYSA
jgi:hypothetical protein